MPADATHTQGPCTAKGQAHVTTVHFAARRHVTAALRGCWQSMTRRGPLTSRHRGCPQRPKSSQGPDRRWKRLETSPFHQLTTHYQYLGPRSQTLLPIQDGRSKQQNTSNTFKHTHSGNGSSADERVLGGQTHNRRISNNKDCGLTRFTRSWHCWVV